jgi:hypothetical protein
MEVIIGGSAGTLYVWDTVTDTPYHCAVSSQAISSAPALADLNESDADQNLDIVVTDMQGSVFSISYPGTTCVPGWTVSLGNAPVTAPTIGDVDGDDALEVVTARMRSGKIFVLNSDGSQETVIAGTTGQISAPPSISDIDRDGDYEILVTDDTHLYLWHGSTVRPWGIIMGFPVDRGNAYRDGMMSTVALYPTDVRVTEYDPVTEQEIRFQVQLENRGTGKAYDVVVRFVGQTTGFTVATGQVTVPVTIDEAGGTNDTVWTPDFHFTNYTGAQVYLYFDIVYRDVQGSEYLIHR